MGNLHGKRILLFQQRGWGKTIGRFIAKKLYDEGAKLAAITFKETTHELIVRQPDIHYEHVVFGDGIMSDARAYLGETRYTLEEICKELGIDSIWPLVHSMRLFTKSYKDKYYFGFKQNVSNERIIEYVMAMFKTTKFFFNEFKPDIIVCPTFVTLPHIIFNLYGLKHGVPMIAITDSKIPGHYIFVEDYMYTRGRFFDYLNELNTKKIETPSRARARTFIENFRKNFLAPTDATQNIIRQKTISEELRNLGGLIRQIIQWYIKPPKNVLHVGPTYEYRSPRILIRDYVCDRSYRKYMDTLRYPKLDAIKKYAYFPLQFQPEEAIDVRAAYFSNQIETIRLVAQSLPGDYTLVVKEHPAMVGRRPASYIEKVIRTPNVQFVDYRIPSEQILKKAALVVSASSTTISEAAFLRVPTIQLGDLGTTLTLPNVTHHTDMTTLTTKIKELLGITLATEAYERRLENYVAAVFDTGLEYNYIKMWERGGENINDLWLIYKNEIERLVPH